MSYSKKKRLKQLENIFNPPVYHWKVTTEIDGVLEEVIHEVDQYTEDLNIKLVFD